MKIRERPFLALRPVIFFQKFFLENVFFKNTRHPSSIIIKQSKLNISDLMGGSIILKTISVPFLIQKLKGIILKEMFMLLISLLLFNRHKINRL